MKRAAFFIPIALALLIVSIAAAQTGGGYDLSWNTSDGGGGTATGGGYRIDHTLGQADAGTQSGGGYTLNGGFWSGVNFGAAPTPVSTSTPTSTPTPTVTATATPTTTPTPTATPTVNPALTHHLYLPLILK